MLTDKDRNLIEDLQRLLKQRLNKTNERNITFLYSEAGTIPILKNELELKKILGVIKEKTNGGIIWEEKIGPQFIPHTSAGDTEIYPRFTSSKPLGIEIHIDDPRMVNAYFEQVLAGKRIFNGKIETIEIIERKEDLKAEILINKEQIERPIKISVKKGRWRKLWEVAKNGKSTEIRDAKSVADYFNNNTSCPIYSRTQYDLTEILIVNNNRLLTSPGIKIILKGPKTIARRKNT